MAKTPSASTAPRAAGRAGTAGRGDSPFDAEAIVVGSGFGGAVTACRLAQAGFDVLVLERGRRYEQDDFPALPSGAEMLPDLRRWRWQEDQGLWDVADLEEIVAVQAAGYGGGSLIYANVHLRPPAEVFDDRWPEAYRGGQGLQGFYDLAAHMLEVEPVSAHPAFESAIVKANQMEQAAGHLGRKTFHPPLAIRYGDGPNLHGVSRKPCNSCGNCCAGCRHEAKNTLDVTYLAIAERHGARAMTQCEVTGLRDLGDEGWEVRCLDHLRALNVRLRARYVFLCAGSIHSTLLLARARLRESARGVQALVGVGYFPGADAIGLVYDTKHEQFPSFGPTITTAIVHWDEEKPESFFLVEDGGYGRQLERIMGVLRAPAWAGRNRLSTEGRAAVGPSPKTPPPAPPLETSTGSGVLPQLDAVLDAVAKGDFRNLLGRDAREAFSAFVDELRGPLLLPPLVDATLERALRGMYARTWPLKYLDPGGPLLRLATWLAKRIGYCLLGQPPVLAGHVLRAMLSGADLDRAGFARQVLGVDSDRASRRAMFLCMGRDAATGLLRHDARRDRLVADLDLFGLAPGYANEERLMKALARALGGELRTNPAWAFLGKPVTVHNQGGCRMSDEGEPGVTTDEGQVRGCDGLYVLDGAILCGSIGANPSATIMAIAERNVLAFIRKHRSRSWPAGEPSAGAEEYRRQCEGAREWAKRAKREEWDIRPPPRGAAAVKLENRPLGLRFLETMQGYYAPASAALRVDARSRNPVTSDLHGDGYYRKHETAGCPEFPIKLKLAVSVENLAAFFEDERHEMRLRGTITLRLPDAAPHRKETRRVEGSLQLMVRRVKPHAEMDARRRRAQEAVTGRPYRARADGEALHRERFLRYDLSFSDAAGRPWRLKGYKRIRKQRGIDTWRATSSLFCRLHGPLAGGATALRRSTLSGAGVVHVDFTSFLRRQLPSMRVTPRDEDPARKTWALAKFAAFFFGNLQRIYLPELGSVLDNVLRAQIGDERHHPL